MIQAIVCPALDVYKRQVWYAPQSSKDTQVLCAGQIWIKAGGLNQASDTGQQQMCIRDRHSDGPHSRNARQHSQKQPQAPFQKI